MNLRIYRKWFSLLFFGFFSLGRSEPVLVTPVLDKAVYAPGDSIYDRGCIISRFLATKYWTYVNKIVYFGAYDTAPIGVIQSILSAPSENPSESPL